jgi:hypothetical protein
MSTLLTIQLISALSLLIALTVWIVLARQLRRDGLSGWRAAPIGLVLSLGAIGYGAYWTVFFSGPTAAVQMHAVWLTVRQVAGGALPWIVGGVTLLACWPLLRWLRQEFG